MIQLILFPQVYDGFYSYTGPSSTGGGTNSGSSSARTAAPRTQSQIPGTQYLGSPQFSTGVQANSTRLAARASGFTPNDPLLISDPAPLGRWKSSATDNALKTPFFEAGVLTLSTEPQAPPSLVTNTMSCIYTTVDQLQSGNSYRVLVTIERSDAGQLRLGSTGENSWIPSSSSAKQRPMTQLGGRRGMLQGGLDWINAETGEAVGNPIESPITTQARFYQDFIADQDMEVLQLSRLSETHGGETVISTVSLVSSTANYTSANDGTRGPVRSSGGSGASSFVSVQTFITDGQVIVDLYKDESIPLVLSVDNFTNVDEKIASYSKAFLCPATKRNNKIFAHYFDVTRTQNHDPWVFNPYAKTKAIIKDDTVIVFEGWMKLINVQEKNGQISYNINLYSEPTTFCDYLKANTIGALDFNELAHDYDFTNIEASWDSPGLNLTTPLPAGSYAGAAGATQTMVMKYPVCNWQGAFELMEITNPADTIRVNNFEALCRPWLQCKYLLDKMFEATPFSYSSNFLNSAYFKKLFMDFNWGSSSGVLAATFNVQSNEEIGSPSSSTAGTSTGVGSWERMIFPTMTQEEPAGTQYVYYDTLTGVFTNLHPGANIICWGNARFKRTHYNTEGEWRAVKTEFATGIVSTVATGAVHWLESINAGCYVKRFDCDILPSVDHECGAGYQLSGGIMIPMEAGDEVIWEFRKSGGCGGMHLSDNSDISNWSYTSYESSYNSDDNNNFFFQITGGQATMAFLMQGLRSQMKQYDFWAGIKEMFNLVTMPDKTRPNHLIIEPYNDIFIDNPNSKLWDWTNKIDLTNIKHEPCNKIPKRTIFTYEEDKKDYRLTVYQNALAGYYYGTKVYEAGDQFFSLLTGEKKITAKPFAPTLVAPLSMIHPNFIISHIYGANKEGTEFEPIDNKPRILYDNGLQTMPTGVQILFALYGGWFPHFTSTYGSFSHLNEIPTTPNTVDLNFGECPLVNPVGNSPTDNLFNTYWAPYYNELYNPDTRVLKLKIALTPRDIFEFNFYDRIYIKNREYRVNKIKYNSGTLAQVELILIT
jgi:hypothetical protein